MKSYHVFIDRTQDRSAEAVVQVAARIAARFRIPPAQLEQRLRAGRFRVKADVDLPTAQRVVAELEGLGAVCSLEPAAAAAGSAPQLPTPPAASMVPAGYQSGLAAARTATGDHQLGALADEGAMASGTFKLTTLDGDADESPRLRVSAVAPPPAPEPEGLLTLMAGAEPAPARPPAPVEPEDRFAPPEIAMERNNPLEMAVTPMPRPTAAAPPPELPDPMMPEAPHEVGSALTLNPPDSRLDRALTYLADQPRVRFAAGVFLAVLLGFIPAHVVSSLRETAAYAQIEGELGEQYARMTTPQELAGAETLRKAKLDQMRSRQVSFGVTGCGLWALIAAGLAYLWFRRIDWSRYASLPAPSSSPSGSGGGSST